MPEDSLVTAERLGIYFDRNLNSDPVVSWDGVRGQSVVRIRRPVALAASLKDAFDLVVAEVAILQNEGWHAKN